MDLSWIKRKFYPSPGDAVNRVLVRPKPISHARFIRGAARLLIGPVERELGYPSKLEDVISLGTFKARYPYLDFGDSDFLDPLWMAPEITWP